MRALFRIRKNNAYELCRSVKWFLSIDVHFVRQIADGESETDAHFTSPGQTLVHSSDISEQMNLATSSLQGKIESFVGTGSGWRVEQIKQVSISFAIYDPMGVSSYIPLPGGIKKTRGLR